MITTAIVYLSVGIILVLVGPLSQDLSQEIDKVESDNSKVFKLRKALFIISIVLFGILLYPIFYYSYFFQNGKKRSNFRTKEYEKGKLYFTKIPGKGNIICKDCDHKESITGFMHGLDVNVKKRTSERGQQCQTCGKLFVTFSYEDENLHLKNCDCGGNLQRELPLFCPKCKSNNLMYNLKYIT